MVLDLLVGLMIWETNNIVKIEKKWLVDPYQLSIVPMISEGLYSIVYEGLYKSDEPVAIKVTQPDKSLAVSPERKEKFEMEVSMLSNVKP